MKYKFFSGGDPAKVEKEVNDWAAKQGSSMTVQHSDTKLTVVPGGKSMVGVMTIGIWYD